VLLAEGVELLVLDCEDALLSGVVVLLVPGVELVELELPTEPVDDCEPIVEELEALVSGELELLLGLDCEAVPLTPPAVWLEPLVLGLLLEVESGVAVLLLVLEPTLLLALDCELASGVVELLAEVLGEELDVAEFCEAELISEDDDELLAVCGGVELLLDEPLFGVVVLLLGDPVLVELPLVLLEPALPEMLPAVFWSVLEVEELGLELADAPDVPPIFPALALETVRSSFTFFTPATDFAIFLACFLSSLLATCPARVTVPLSTVI